MIIEALLNFGLNIIDALLDLLDVLPNMPESVVTAIGNYLDLVFDNMDILPFFFPVSFALPLLGIVIVLANWKRLYHFIKWAYDLLPTRG